MSKSKDQFVLTPYFLDAPLPGLRVVAEPGWVVNEPHLPAGPVQQRMVAIYEPLAAQVATAVAADRRPVSVAGDCCAALGMAAGLQRSGIKPTLIWFDAHGDFNTWETSPSGFLGGMPLAMLVGRGEMTMPDGLGLRPLSELQVYLSDGRDLDVGEEEALLSSDVNLMPVVGNLKAGLLPLGPLWVHFDVDVLRTADMPAVNYPAEGGPSADMLGRVFTALARSGQVAAVSVSSWNPALDEDGRARNTALKLLQLLLA